MLELDIRRIPFKEVPYFSRTDIAYASDPESFGKWIAHLPTLEAFADVIEQRKSLPVDREALTEVLKAQYDLIGATGDHLNELSKENQFFITTAHQPSLLTGPLYFIYKICSAINLARTLEVQYSSQRIHPLMILGGEDHDLAEINHLHLFGNRFEWKTAQSGACGRMSLDGLPEVFEDLFDVLGSSPFADELRMLIKECFQEPFTYGQAMQKFVLKLFEGSRLIVLSMDDPVLKAQFASVMKDELVSQTSHDIIEKSQKSLEDNGYKPQAYIREINLFYLTESGRHRVEQQGDDYQIVDTDIRFSKEKLLQEVDQHPEKFSPNVNLRPLYQETVLPNLAYIGGGGELAYWLERKAQFEHYEVSFPVLIRRNSVMYINKGNRKLRNKLSLSAESLFQRPEKIVKDWVTEHANHEVEVGDEKKLVAEALDKIVEKARKIDPTVARKIDAFKTTTLNDIDGLEKRMVRAEKAQHENAIKQIHKLHGKLFPEGGLQERHDNFMMFYLSKGPEFIERLIEILDPLQAGFLILEEQ